MIALDTNILVRLLTRDDERQAEKARRLFDDLADDDGFFISDMVLVELVWTLERAYGFDRATIGMTFKALTDNATLDFESRDMLHQAHALFESGKAGFADCLIAAKAQARGCESLMTFDKALRGMPNVVLL